MCHLTDEIAALKTQLYIQQQHSGFDIAGLKADNAVFLGKLLVLLKDAEDALEIDEPRIALGRIRTAMSRICLR